MAPASPLLTSDMVRAVTTPDALRALLGDGTHNWPVAQRHLLVAAHGRVFDADLVRALVELPATTAEILARNPHLAAPERSVLARWAAQVLVHSGPAYLDNPQRATAMRVWNRLVTQRGLPPDDPAVDDLLAALETDSDARDTICQALITHPALPAEPLARVFEVMLAHHMWDSPLALWHPHATAAMCARALKATDDPQVFDAIIGHPTALQDPAIRETLWDTFQHEHRLGPIDPAILTALFAAEPPATYRAHLGWWLHQDPRATAAALQVITPAQAATLSRTNLETLCQHELSEIRDAALRILPHLPTTPRQAPRAH